MTSRALLVASALAGASLAAVSLVERGPRSAHVPDDAVAVVNGTEISRADYERAVAAVTTARRDVDARVRRRVLERLIDEELLVQRGVELGLARRDPRVRTDLGAAVIELVSSRAQTDAAAPTDAALRQFYADNPHWFARPAQVRVRQALFGSEGEALAARRRVASGASFAEVAAAAPAPTPLPDRLLPPAKLRDYLGPTAARTAVELPTGDVSDPVRTAAGWVIVQPVERVPGRVRPFEDVRDLVEREYVRGAGDRHVRAFLERSRADAVIAVAEDRL